ncbi:MAG: CsbD family protein [Balneolaceae bacterium]|nr:MAG: CsbD family protein [Balneolaceae bacterium]
MNNIKIKGNWNQLKGKLKQKYGDLTDDDLTYVEGKDDEFIGKLQEKLGKTRAEIASEIKDLLN